MTIYIDREFRCHITNDGTRTPVETDFFCGKCQTFVEGYRLIPSGESWTREDGTRFRGEMIAPWKPYGLLDEAQRNYEQALIADMKTALHTLGVTLDG